MKRFISIILTTLMIVMMLPSFAVSAFADEAGPGPAGPNDSDHAYLDFHSNGEDYSFYFMGNPGDAEIAGVSYDLATNTLTLDNYNEPSTIIEASEMGSDFKISVIGENHIKAIIVMADRYMGSLTIDGEGSLFINENKEFDDVPLFVDANNTDSMLMVADSVQLSVSVYDDDVSVKVLNSTSKTPILCTEAEPYISSYEDSSTQKRWIQAHDTQQNTFWPVKDSDYYTTLCWDESAQDTLYYQYVLVNKMIDGNEVLFADPTMDDMGNPDLVPSEQVDTSKTITACQILNPYERSAVEKENDETEYTLTEYTVGEEGPFFDIHKVIHDEDLGPFFYPVAEKLTEMPEEYTTVLETINNNYQYIEGSFANFEAPEPSENGFSLSANVRGSAITYRDGDNLCIEAGKTALISFEISDENGVPYVPAWYSIDMAEAGLDIAPDPTVIDDIYYASITNYAAPGASGTLIINAFSGEKFADPAFDFITTEPDATFTLNIISVDKYEGVVSIGDQTYPEDSTITINPGETIKMYYDVPSYPEIAIHGIDPDPMTDAGFGFELEFDESEMPYAMITAGEDLAPGTKAEVPISIMRIEDCILSGFDFSITPSIYSFAVTIEVAGEVPCEHHYIAAIGVDPKCEVEGRMDYECEFCHDSYSEVIPAEGHDLERIEGVGATCFSTGLTDGYRCKNCDYQIRQEETPMLEHSYQTKVTPATATSDGKIVKTCTTLGCTKRSITPIKKVSTIKLSTSSYVYDGKTKNPTVIVKDSNDKPLVKGTDYTISVPSGRKNVGKYTYKITFKGNYSDTKSVSFTIVPKGTSLSSLTAASKGFTVKWKKQATQTTGYQIQLATNNIFTKKVQLITVSKNRTVSKKITKLLGKQKYYVRIRTYKTVSGTKYCSSWSAIKTVTTKR